MNHDEYAGSTRDNKCRRSDTSGTNGVAGSDDSYVSICGVCNENKASGDKICGPFAREFYLFIQNGLLKISTIIKEPFYRIGEAFSDMVEHPIIRAGLYMAVIFCLIALFIEIGYVAALHEYGIVPGNTPIGG